MRDATDSYLSAIANQHSKGLDTMPSRRPIVIVPAVRQSLPSEDDRAAARLSELDEELRAMSVSELSAFMRKFDDDRHPLEMKAFFRERARRESLAAERYLSSLGERA